MKILVLDNYDSFTYNIVHALKSLGYSDVEVFRNDKIALEEIKKYDKIILSPGPGIPSESGILNELIKRYSSEKSILGICLGEQAIGEVFGATLVNLSKVYHGVDSVVKLGNDDALFRGLPAAIIAGRYHSWVVSEEGFPQCLEVTARDEEGKIMALKHKTYDVRGVQFHPESVLTPFGIRIIANWLNS